MLMIKTKPDSVTHHTAKHPAMVFPQGVVRAATAAASSQAGTTSCVSPSLRMANSEPPSKVNSAGPSMLRKKGVQAKPFAGKFHVEAGKPRIGIHCELIGGATDDLRCGFERRNCNKIVVVWEPGEPISKGMDAIHIKKQA